MFQVSEPIIDPAQIEHFETACEFAVGLGGASLMDHFGRTKSWKKAPGDWVSQADLDSQEAIRNFLLNQFPAHGFLGEESSEQLSEFEKPLTGFEADEVRFRWIVDPLDGTVNFLHQLRSFSVSIALMVIDGRGRQQMVTGAVFDPVLDECFIASLGKGARFNGDPIRVSDCQDLDGALVVTSANTKITASDPQVKRLLNVMATPASVRRLGSAALNLCYLACGRVDANWATNLNCWDVAAGWLIAAEAGAVFESLDAGPLNVMRPKFCVTSTKELMEQFRPLMQVT